MNRRTAACLISVIVVALAPLVGCGGSKTEAPAQPAVVAAKPRPTPPPARPTSPPARPRVEPPPPVPASSPEPPSAPSTDRQDASAGSIPPAPVVDASAEAQPKEVDPLQWLQESEAKKAEYEKKVQDAAAAVENARVAAEQWQRNLLAIKNPFLARPKFSPEDTAAISAMDGVQRANWAETHLADARAASDAAQKALEDLKANPPQ